MQFGEIVEPSTRALILDDDLEELPEYKEPVYEWKGDTRPPNDLEQLIFVDSPKVVQLCFKLSKNTQPVAKLRNEGLSIYRFHKHHLAIFDGNCTNLVIGEIVQLFLPWLRKAKAIHCITSTLTSTFQPLESLTASCPITFTRCLTNHEAVPYNFCKRLESPNLIQGFGASILTYCVHLSLKVSLWIVYTDNIPQDSVNSAEILRLLRALGLDVHVDFTVDISSSNLYM